MPRTGKSRTSSTRHGISSHAWPFISRACAIAMRSSPAAKVHQATKQYNDTIRVYVPWLERCRELESDAETGVIRSMCSGDLSGALHAGCVGLPLSPPGEQAWVAGCRS